MPLLVNDSNATDLIYMNLQKDLFWLDPPDLARKHVEELYSETSSLLDNKFVEQCKHDFHSCYAEMYFAATFKSRCGYELTHPSDEGLDFFIPSLKSWMEVVTLTNGASGKINSIPKHEYDSAHPYPEEKVILRIRSAIEAKSEKIKQDIEKGLVKPDQSIILCISGGGLEERTPIYLEGGYPQAIKALLPIGDLTSWQNRETNKIVSCEYKYRPEVKKQTEHGPIGISTACFLDQKYKHISAVIYSWATAAHPIARDRWGCDYYTIHNPCAINPLPNNFIRCGVEYGVIVEDDFFTVKPATHHEKIKN